MYDECDKQKLSWQSEIILSAAVSTLYCNAVRDVSVMQYRGC
ncbi:hypothetical protein DDI_3708 [Dickeya dianthicola RNS04.9]|nr:hypothetical protein DDI_3708 [Dickeya dianthicola RNS04.9]